MSTVILSLKVLICWVKVIKTKEISHDCWDNINHVEFWRNDPIMLKITSRHCQREIYAPSGQNLTKSHLSSCFEWPFLNKAKEKKELRHRGWCYRRIYCHVKGLVLRNISARNMMPSTWCVYLFYFPAIFVLQFTIICKSRPRSRPSISNQRNSGACDLFFTWLPSAGCYKPKNFYDFTMFSFRLPTKRNFR